MVQPKPKGWKGWPRGEEAATAARTGQSAEMRSSMAGGDLRSEHSGGTL
jgi:hypothetical protein